MKNSYISSFKKSTRYNLRAVYVIVFFAALLVLGTFFEILNRTYFLKQSKNYITLNSFEDVKEETELLFLGDSHFINGIAPGHFDDNSFVLSFGGSNYIKSYYVLKHFLPSMQNLKAVIIPLDLHSFSSFRSDRVDDIFFNDFIDFTELSEIKDRTFRSGFTITIFHETLGRYFFFVNFKNMLLRKNKAGQELAGNNNLFSSEYEQSLLRVRYHLKDSDPLDKDLLLYFNKTIELCKNNDLQLFTLQMPLSSHYIESSKQFISKSELLSNTLGSPELIDRNIINFDCLELYLDRDDYFMPEGDHLNPVGMKAFSEYLSYELKNHLK
ncbi:MAG: hypothetical protein GY863_15805 [bacterium]|nr:hypothetical protein [bacterium]